MSRVASLTALCLLPALVACGDKDPEDEGGDDAGTADDTGEGTGDDTGGEVVEDLSLIHI